MLLSAVGESSLFHSMSSLFHVICSSQVKSSLGLCLDFLITHFGFITTLSSYIFQYSAIYA